MSLLATYGPDFLVNLAASLAFELMQKGSSRLRMLLFGTAEQQALDEAWRVAFFQMLTAVAPPSRDDPNKPDELLTEHIVSLFKEFISADDVAVILLDVALVGQTPPLEKLVQRFDALEFDRSTLPVDFSKAMAALTAGLTNALIEAATEPDSPLHNRVNIVRLVAVQQMLVQQQLSLEKVAAQISQLDAQLRRTAQGNYNLVFLGPMQGFAIGDGETTQMGADLRPLLEQVLAQITKLATPPKSQPYTEEDKAAYLEAVINECQRIKLPIAVESGWASIPLREIYVALKADRSSPVERKASRQLFENIVRDASPRGQRLDDNLIAKLAALDPYAGRFLMYDKMREELLADRQNNEAERTYDLAEILRRHRWLILLGDPGSGKSTLARWLALHLALAVQNQTETVEVPADHVRPEGEPSELISLGLARLPVLVRLADYAAARWPSPDIDMRLPLHLFLGQHTAHLLEPGRENRSIYSLIKDYRAAGRVTFILDGLDEVTNLDQRQTIAAEIETLIQTWLPEDDGQTPLTAGYHRLLASPTVSKQGNQLIVTSRIVGYQLRPLHENLPHFVIQPMGDAAVTRFCQNWARYTGIPERTEPLVQGVLKHPNPNVREQMARNPLLLTILAQVFSSDPEAGLPARRAELYRQAQMAVFSQRATRRWHILKEQVTDEDLPRVLERLTAYVAYQLHGHPDYPNALADKRALSRWLGVAIANEPALASKRRVEDTVQDLLGEAAHLSGFFVERGDGVYGFLHRQFQEYFAAVYLVQQSLKETEAARRWQPILSRIADPNWQEVILLAVGILERAAAGEVADLLAALLAAPDPTSGMLARNILLTATAVTELHPPPDGLVQQVATGLIAAHCREDVARFAVLNQPVKEVFAQLPRPERGRDPVGQAFCHVLTDAVGDDELGRFLRLSACELVVETEWYTPAVTRALALAWRSYVEPAGMMLFALQRIHAAYPDYFVGQFLPVRRQWADEWESVVDDEAWAEVLWALYLDPTAETPTADAVVRDSPLTPGLQTLLRPGPADRESLLTWLRQQWQTEVGPARRDVGVALWYLGDIQTLLPFLLEEDSHEGTVVFHRSLVGVTSLGRDRALALGRDLALGRALGRDRDLALALGRDLDRALDLALALGRARALARTLDLARARALGRDRDLALALDRDLALGLDRARDLALGLALGRDRALDLARFYKDLLEIRAILEKALQRPVIQSEIETSLLQARTSLQHLIELFSLRHGVWLVWQAWGDAIAGQEIPLDWARPGRIRLALPSLSQLIAQLEREKDLKEWPRLDGTPLATLSDADKSSARALLTTGWQMQTETAARPHLALLLAEMKVILPETIPFLIHLVVSSNDLMRYRAQAALQSAFEQPASLLGQEAIETLARYDAAQESMLADTYQSWALNQIQHDQPEWLQQWIEAGEKAILSRIHDLTDQAWPVYLASLTEADAEVQEQMLEATSWLIRFTKKDNIPLDLREILFTLCQHTNVRVQTAALTALGYWRSDEADVLKRLVDLGVAWQEKGLAAYLNSLARLTAQIKETDIVTTSKAIVRQHLPLPAALTALVRLLVGQQGEKLDLYTLWSFIADNQVSVLGVELLPAMLQAGTDDDGWGNYHETITHLIQELVQEEEGLLARLLTFLQEALDRDKESWPSRRITLAAIAACASAMPDALNTVWAAEDVTELLIAGAKDIKSFTSRRHSILALSHLRTLTPAVLDALLSASQDIGRVQQDAVRAASNFRRLHLDFGDADALVSLEAALNGESGAAAYIAAQVLGSLGSSAAAAQVTGLRARIAHVLSEAAQNEQAGEMVYLLGDSNEIIEAGTRAEVILAALSQVWALPGR
jgi:hypothetical protein